MFLPIMAGPAQIDGRSLLREIEVIGGVRIVTGDALAVVHRLVLRFRCLLSSYGVFMAAAAQGNQLAFEKPVLLRGMRIMAGEAAPLAENGPVNPVLGKSFVHQLVMATTAEFVTLFFRLQGVRRGGLFMALIAHLAGNRPMHIGIQYPRQVGAVRVVATGTACLRHRIVHMRLDEVGTVGLMTSDAEGGHIVLQEYVSLA